MHGLALHGLRIVGLSQTSIIMSALPRRELACGCKTIEQQKRHEAEPKAMYIGRRCAVCAAAQVTAAGAATIAAMSEEPLWWMCARRMIPQFR